MEADQDGDGKLSFEEFAQTVANTVCSYPIEILSLTSLSAGYSEANDSGRPVLSEQHPDLLTPSDSPLSEIPRPPNVNVSRNIPASFHRYHLTARYLHSITLKNYERG